MKIFFLLVALFTPAYAMESESLTINGQPLGNMIQQKLLKIESGNKDGISVSVKESDLQWVPFTKKVKAPHELDTHKTGNLLLTNDLVLGERILTPSHIESGKSIEFNQENSCELEGTVLSTKGQISITAPLLSFGEFVYFSAQSLVIEAPENFQSQINKIEIKIPDLKFGVIQGKLDFSKPWPFIDEFFIIGPSKPKGIEVALTFK